MPASRSIEQSLEHDGGNLNAFGMLLFAEHFRQVSMVLGFSLHFGVQGFL